MDLRKFMFMAFFRFRCSSCRCQARAGSNREGRAGSETARPRARRTPARARGAPSPRASMRRRLFRPLPFEQRGYLHCPEKVMQLASPFFSSSSVFPRFRPPGAVFGPRGLQKRAQDEKPRRMDPGRGPGTHFEGISGSGASSSSSSSSLLAPPSSLSCSSSLLSPPPLWAPARPRCPGRAGSSDRRCALARSLAPPSCLPPPRPCPPLGGGEGLTGPPETKIYDFGFSLFSASRRRFWAPGPPGIDPG